MNDKCPPGTGVSDKECKVVIVQNRGHDNTDEMNPHEGKSKGV